MSGNEFVITETGGEERSITLRGRSMPDKGEEPADFGLSQRGRINYPPWQPVADISILGAVWEPLRIVGRWDDKYMDQVNAPLLGKFKNLGSRGPGGITANNGRARNCIEITEAVTLLVRTAETLKVEWGPFTRYGILWEFHPRFERPERCAWEMEFRWSGDTNIKPVVKARPKLSPLGLLELLLALLEALRRAIQILNAPAKFYTNNILAPFNQLVSAIEGVINELTKVIANAITPSRVLGDLRAGFTKIKLACVDLLRALDRQVNFGGDTLNPRDSALADFGVLIMRKEIIACAAAMAEREREMAKLDVPDLIDSIFTSDGETLRDVAKRFYGSASDWIIIAEYNSFVSAVVPTNTLVLIPSKVAAA